MARDERSHGEHSLPRLLDRPQARAALKISVSKLDQLVASGRLRSIRIGRRRLIPAEAIEDFIEGLGRSE